MALQLAINAPSVGNHQHPSRCRPPKGISLDCRAVSTLWNIGTNNVDYPYQLGLLATRVARTYIQRLLQLKRPKSVQIFRANGGWRDQRTPHQVDDYSRFWPILRRLKKGPGATRRSWV